MKRAKSANCFATEAYGEESQGCLTKKYRFFRHSAHGHFVAVTKQNDTHKTLFGQSLSDAELYVKWGESFVVDATSSLDRRGLIYFALLEARG